MVAHCFEYVAQLGESFTDAAAIVVVDASTLEGATQLTHSRDELLAHAGLRVVRQLHVDRLFELGACMRSIVGVVAGRDVDSRRRSEGARRAVTR